jgi:RNA polymerase sigma-70 factor (ECF subfamily)
LDRSDLELVQAVLRGERDAFALLYDRYARLVRALCQSQTGDPHAAADLSQEVFLRAFRRLHTLVNPDRFSAWLVGITRLVCREWRRARRQPGPQDGAFDAIATDTAAADATGMAVTGASRRLKTGATCTDDLERAERHRHLLAALAELPERDRLALHAFYVQDLGVERMCHLLGVSRSGLYHVLATARRRLAEKLDRQEVLP